MDSEALIAIGTQAIYKAHTEGLDPKENYRHLTERQQASAVINALLDRGFSIQRFRAVGYFDHFGAYHSGCPPLTEVAGWKTALILVED